MAEIGLRTQFVSFHPNLTGKGSVNISSFFQCLVPEHLAKVFLLSHARHCRRLDPGWACRRERARSSE